MQTNEQLLLAIENYLAQTEFPAEPERLYAPIGYSLAGGGKRLRPMLLMLAHGIFTDRFQAALPAAAAVEVFHNFTLLHDDIMDNAAVRRGKPSVYAKWGPSVAILSGDAMMICAYRLLSEVPAELLPRILGTFNTMALEVCEGQQYDMDFESKRKVSVVEYMHMIELKTSVLLAGSVTIGAMLGGASEEDCRKLRRFAIELGLAFQLQDDLLDSYGDDRLGKAIGGDILEGKQTYLMITAMSRADEATREALRTTRLDARLSDAEKIAAVKSIYDRLDVPRLTEQQISLRFERALSILDTLSADKARTQRIREYAESLIGRKTDMRRSDIEIMAPVGSYESLAAAIQAGADSVYFGVGKLNMRSASAANFTLDDLAKIVATARAAGVKTYLTVNTIVYEDELRTVHEVIDRAKAEGIDAVIASDFAAILYARRIGVEVHISTQSNISNSEAVKFFSQWADTVVLARELTLEQVARIHREIAENDIRGPRGELVQLEMFAHGALCMSVSGKCYLSLYETNCSANRGACRQLCRRKYTVTDKETGAALDVDGRYVLSPKDLCTVDFLDKFIGAGVRVLKIEGRARGAEYVKRVVECYDEALRAIEAGTYTPELAAGLKERLATVFNRGFWEGYYAGRPVAEHSEHYGSAATRRKVYVGKVTNFYKRISVAEVLVEAAPLAVGEEIFFMGATTGVAEQTLAELHDTDGKPVPSVAQGTLCAVRTQGTIRRGDQLYKFVDAQ